MKFFLVILTLAFQSATICAEEILAPEALAEVKVEGKAKDALVGEWRSESFSTDPKFHSVFKVDEKGNVEHYIYTGWKWDTKHLMMKLSGSINTKSFEQDRTFTLTYEKTEEKISIRVRFIKNRVLFLWNDADHSDSIFNHLAYKNLKK